MATSDMVPSLYAAPVGLATLDEAAPPVEIEIVNPDEVHIGIDGLEIDLEPQPESAEEFDANLAEYMDDSELQSLASQLIDDFNKDTRDRKEWVQTYIDGLKLLGLRYEERTEPWNGACGVFHPKIGRAHV